MQKQKPVETMLGVARNLVGMNKFEASDEEEAKADEVHKFLLSSANFLSDFEELISVGKGFVSAKKDRLPIKTKLIRICDTLSPQWCRAKWGAGWVAA
jgi:hypothetical protein